VTRDPDSAAITMPSIRATLFFGSGTIWTVSRYSWCQKGRGLGNRRRGSLVIDRHHVTAGAQARDPPAPESTTRADRSSAPTPSRTARKRDETMPCVSE